MDKMILETSHSRRSTSDRFIPRRTNSNSDSSSYYYIEESDGSNYINFNYTDPIWFVNTAKLYYNLEHYRSELKKTILPDTDRVLVFSSPKKKVKYTNKKNHESSNPWPVYPRSKPLLEPPPLTLDMPDLDTDLSHHVVDWGKKGFIATIYEKEVHLWHPDDNLSRQVTNTQGKVESCLKWNSDGSAFAVAMELSGIGICDYKNCKVTNYNKCGCYLSPCTVAAMEWTNDNCLITGCTFGTLTSWSKDLVKIKRTDFAHFEIINIKISCNEHFVVTSGMDKRVRVWEWPSMEGLIDIAYREGPIKALAWHPWKDSLLVIGGSSSIDLWNVNIMKQLESKRHPRDNSLVDCITFNPLSAELVVSYFIISENDCIHFLSVLRDLEHIIDEAQFHSGRVPYLLWDDTGTKLATASSDENLCIWNFFGNSTATEKKYLKLSKKQKLSTDMFQNLNIFNSYIR